jgi:hypothetical protein
MYKCSVNILLNLGTVVKMWYVFFFILVSTNPYVLGHANYIDKMPLNYVLRYANDIGITVKMPLNYVLGHANDIGISDKMPFNYVLGHR